MTAKSAAIVALVFVFTCVRTGLAQSEADPQLQQQVLAAKDKMAAGKNAEAIELFKKLVKEHKDCALCWLGMGYADLRTGNLEEADKCANKTLSLSADDVDRIAAHNLKGEVLLANSPKDSKAASKAEAEFRECVKLSPDKAGFHLNLARSLLKQSKDDEAASELRTCLSLHPAPAMAETANKYLSNPKRGREEFAPTFHFTTLQGDEISLQRLAGKMVVMDFWATWCPPCRESVPELRELTKKYPDRVVLISVSADNDDKKWREFVSKHEMSWHQYRDANHQVLDAFAIHAFPTYLVLDGDGAVKQRIVGMNPQETIVHRLKEYLASVPELAAK